MIPRSTQPNTWSFNQRQDINIWSGENIEPLLCPTKSQTHNSTDSFNSIHSQTTSHRGTKSVTITRGYDNNHEHLTNHRHPYRSTKSIHLSFFFHSILTHASSLLLSTSIDRYESIRDRTTGTHGAELRIQVISLNLNSWKCFDSTSLYKLTLKPFVLCSQKDEVDCDVNQVRLSGRLTRRLSYNGVFSVHCSRTGFCR